MTKKFINNLHNLTVIKMLGLRERIFEGTVALDGVKERQRLKKPVFYLNILPKVDYGGKDLCFGFYLLNWCDEYIESLKPQKEIRVTARHCLLHRWMYNALKIEIIN